MATTQDFVTVVRIVSHEFGNSRPLILAQHQAANDVIVSGQQATQEHLDLVAQLPLNAFITLNVSDQWMNTQAHLWRSLQIAFHEMDLDVPVGWGPSMTFSTLANYM